MLQYAKLSALPEPGRRNMQELRKWIKDPARGNYSIAFEGAQVWGALYKPEENNDGNDGRNTKHNTSWTLPELVTLRPHQKMNALEGWIAYSLLPSVRKYAHPISQRISRYMRRTREEILPCFKTNESLEQEEKRKLEDTKRKSSVDPKLVSCRPTTPPIT